MAHKKKSPLGFGVFRLYTEREKDQHIGALVAQWEKEREEKRLVGNPFLTISREYGCMALETGLRFTECLNELDGSGTKWTLYDKEVVSRIACDMKMNKRLTDLLTSGSREKNRQVHGLAPPKMAGRGRSLREDGSCDPKYL